MTRHNPRISIPASLFQWWRENIRLHGITHACAEFLKNMRDFIRDSTPERRRRRYGDVEFDWEYRVDTTAATLSFRNRLLGVFHSAYEPTEPQSFHEMIRSLGIDYSQFTFLDLGSGKGRTLLMASEYPFRRIVGVELLPELHQVAEDNIRRYKPALGNRVQSICADAARFEFPCEPAVLFLFNPFPESVLKDVVTRLTESLRRYPRMAYLIYHNPVLEPVLAATPGMKMLQRADQYTIFTLGL
ncbi:MAG: class I SAM-dependent methyltransferase [Acidobacteria bacterium]|nr:class I SAM-dependent methyltransferase [Acidobacteriota bacterium]